MTVKSKSEIKQLSSEMNFCIEVIDTFFKKTPGYYHLEKGWFGFKRVVSPNIETALANDDGINIIIPTAKYVGDGAWVNALPYHVFVEHLVSDKTLAELAMRLNREITATLKTDGTPRIVYTIHPPGKSLVTRSA